MGVLARRFLNFIVPGCSPGLKSLRRIDLKKKCEPLFYPPLPSPNGDGSEPAAAGGQDTIARSSALEMETIQFSGPSFTFRALNNKWKMNCFPLADYSECKLICSDFSGHGFLFDLDSAMVGTIPRIRPPKVVPISIFVHKPYMGSNLHEGRMGSSLFLMEKFPQPEVRRARGRHVQESEQFVGFINRRSSLVSTKSWDGRLLPPPPFVWETYLWSNNCPPQITSYGVVGGGSHVCISVEGVGTYCLDTESLSWSKVGDWTLPFHGKIEYVPQLKLWFGLSAGAQQHLAAADLSGMLRGSSSFQPRPPRLVGGPWKELVHLPEECKDPQFVSLGSGRFCIARFFSQEAEAGSQVVPKDFTVLTGVEVNSSDKGKLQLQMINHKSTRVYNTSIETLF